MPIPPYQKGDLRRMLAVLAALDDAGEASLVKLASMTGLPRPTIDDLLAQAQEQASVEIAKKRSIYRVVSWGPVIKKSGAKLALMGRLNRRCSDVE